MVVVGLLGVVMVAVPGLPAAMGVQIPVPVAAIVADPPGSKAHVTVWSGPALDLFTVTISVADAEHVPSVYVTVKSDVTVVSVVIVAVVSPVLQRYVPPAGVATGLNVALLPIQYAVLLSVTTGS